jgi:putative ABC transport system permease protein
MRAWITVKIALRALQRNVMRSMLTALGMIIGVGAVIAMVNIGHGAKTVVEAQVASLGQNIITVFPGSTSRGGTRGGWGSHGTLTVDDADAIRREVTDAFGVSPEVRDRSQILANGLNWNTQILGTDPSYPDIRSWPVADGVFFWDDHVRTNAKVCVIGRTIVDQIFLGEEPVGKTLRIRNIPMLVIGVLAPKGFNFNGQDQDDVVIVPYTTHLKRIAHHPTLNSILIQAMNAERIPIVQQQVNDLLSQRRHYAEPDFLVRNQDEIAAAATATSRTMTLLLGAIAGVSLIVGGIGIMNIMLVSVTERTREIGIRLAVGAHAHDVMLQFLAEAIVLSVCGGILGIVAGIGCSEIIARINQWPMALSSVAVASAVLFSGAIGIFFGFYPARKAAKLDPIEALRYE